MLLQEYIPGPGIPLPPASNLAILEEEIFLHLELLYLDQYYLPVSLIPLIDSYYPGPGTIF